MRHIICIALAATIAGPAIAADLGPTPPPVYQPAYAPAYVPGYDWTGLYIGGNVGAGWATGDGTATIFRPGGGVFSVTTSSQDASGVVGGAQIGYNWQFGQWVVGVEADYNASGQRGDNGGIPCGQVLVGSCTVGAHGNVDSFGTVRGRLGFTVGDNRWLIYGTGGYAWQKVSGSVDITTVLGSTSVLAVSTTKSGFAVGAGVEAALWGNWTGGFEYLYLKTGDFDTGGFVVSDGSLLARAGVPVGSSITDTRSVNNNILRAKVNYRF